MRNMKWKIAAAAGVAVMATGGFATFASAQESDTKALDYVDGLDEVTDDWNDHPEELGGALCDGCDYSEGTDLVVLWQSVLAADGFLTEWEDVDGYFGDDTKRATAMWQDQYGLEQTGKVDYDEWATASSQLSQDGTDVSYDGRGEGSIELNRAEDADGTYTLVNVYMSDGAQLENVGGEKIEHYNLTVDLEPV